MHLSNRGNLAFTVGQTTVENVGTATTLLGTTYGNLLVPANTLLAGTIIEWFFWGQYTNQLTIQTMNWNLSLGATSLHSQNTINFDPNVVNNKIWKIYGTCCIRTTGASGELRRYLGYYLWSTNSVSSYGEAYSISNTLNTTVDNTFTFNATNVGTGTNQSNTIYGGWVAVNRP